MPDVTAGATVKLGPGTLKIGATGSAIDVSCLVNNATITTDRSQDDPTYHLCGTSSQAPVTYAHTLTGNLDIDPVEATGLFALSWDQMGSEQAYEFTPNTEAAVAAAGTLILDPLDFGADEYGKTLNSDFEFVLTAAPTYTRGGVTATASSSKKAAK
jgi:hypothetical protein